MQIEIADRISNYIFKTKYIQYMNLASFKLHTPLSSASQL